MSEPDSFSGDATDEILVFEPDVEALVAIHEDMYEDAQLDRELLATSSDSGEPYLTLQDEAVLDDGEIRDYANDADEIR